MRISMFEYISLTQLSRELRVLTGKNAPGYQTLYRHAMEGKIPAERAVFNRWCVRRDHLLQIVSALGLGS
jgi:hypothetical protein